jgi:hypothetical protein
MLGLAVGELEHRGHHGLLVRSQLLAQGVHIVGGLVLRDGHPTHETGEDTSERE